MVTESQANNVSSNQFQISQVCEKFQISGYPCGKQKAITKVMIIKCNIRDKI